jgi:hypothetical protein
MRKDEIEHAIENKVLSEVLAPPSPTFIARANPQ